VKKGNQPFIEKRLPVGGRFFLGSSNKQKREKEAFYEWNFDKRRPRVQASRGG
jgi:hypothetical protein